MDKRFFLALFLSLIAIAISQLLFPTVRPRSSSGAADSTSRRKSSVSSRRPTAVQPPLSQVAETAVLQNRAPTATPGGAGYPVAETTTVTTPRAIYKFSNVGSAPVSIRIRDYNNRSARGGLVDLGAPGSPLVSYRLVTPTDTADLAQVPFKLTRSENPRGDESLVYSTS